MWNLSLCSYKLDSGIEKRKVTKKYTHTPWLLFCFHTRWEKQIRFGYHSSWKCSYLNTLPALCHPPLAVPDTKYRNPTQTSLKRKTIGVRPCSISMLNSGGLVTHLFQSYELFQAYYILPWIPTFTFTFFLCSTLCKSHCLIIQWYPHHLHKYTFLI